MSDEFIKALEEEERLNYELLAKAKAKASVPTTVLNDKSVSSLFKSGKKSEKVEKIIKPILPPVKHEMEVVDYYTEKPDLDTGCMRYYYPTLKDFVDKNLPCVKRPWVQEVEGKIMIGKEVYEDPMMYKPGQIYDYVQKWYINYFEDNGIESPFAYSDKNIYKTSKEICDNTNFTLLPHQKFVGSHMSNMTDFPSLLMFNSLGAGKCMSYGSKVLLFNGKIEEVQNIKIGDRLMGPDSKPRTVLDLGRGIDMMYEVIPRKGETHIFTSAHVLSLKFSNMGVSCVDDQKKWCATWFNNKTIKTECKYFETEEHARQYLSVFTEESKICNIEIKDFIKLPKRMQNQLKLYHVGVDFPSIEVPLDPYILGCWIGNCKNGGKIPDLYKINSREVRLQVLAGIIDTNRGYEFCLVSEKLVDDIIYLVRSLGLAAHKSIKKTMFRTTIYGNIDEIPCKTKYDKTKYDKTKYDKTNTCFKIIEKGIDNYYGFTLDSDHLYLLSDFMVTHNSCSSIVIAESNKGQYLKDGQFEKRKGSLIPQKKVKGSVGADVSNEPCNITVVVPKQTKNQYIEEIRGHIENGEILSCTAACVYTESDQQDSEDYVYMRQIYTGKVNKDTKKPDSESLRQIQKMDRDISQLENDISLLNKKDKDLTDIGTKEAIQSKLDIQNEINVLSEELKGLISDRKNTAESIDKVIDKVYTIITHDTFLNRITTKVKGRHVASNYILGTEKNKKGENLPHYSCIHSDKSVIIIDEVQKLVREGGVNYLRLYDILMVNARDTISGVPRVKIILLTATPIFDNPHEASLMLNFQRPRIPFPLGRIMFEDFFIDKTDKDNCKIKNKMCYQYLNSGYISYSRGATKGFALRRDIIKLHPMSKIQMDGYVNALVYDIKKDSEDKIEDNTNEPSVFDLAYKNQLDDNQQGRYLWSRQLCNIYLPIDNKDSVNFSKESEKEISAENQLEQLYKILKNKTHEEILESFKEYSPKFHFILTKIIESSKKDEGPIVVYCEWVWYGILAMTKVLQLLGWRFLDSNDIENVKGHNKFGIWSSSALSYMKIRDETAYTSNLLKVINHRNNASGKLCKVIFTTVTEGISLKRVSQLHITSPWWNESREEQIAGRGIRFCSHADLDPTRQYVDVYYHCSVLNSFKDYPQINRAVDQTIINVIFDKYTEKPRESNFKDLARLTIEQKVFITARRKNDINNQFEMALKETAIDFQLNKFGNLLRFEEIINPSIRIKNPKIVGSWSEVNENERILYSRSENKYYYYNLINRSLFNLNMLKKESDIGKPVWPSLQAVIGDKIDVQKNWAQHEIIHQSNKNNEIIVSFIVTENLNSFNNNPHVRDKNFKQLMEYSINHLGEEEKVWDHFEEQRLKMKMFNIIVGLYGLAEGTGSSLLMENINDRLLSGGGTHSKNKTNIVKGTGMEVMILELAQKAEDYAKKTNKRETKEEMMNLKKRLEVVATKLPIVEALDDQKTKQKEQKLRSMFFKTSDEDIERMIDVLVKDFRISRDHLKTLSPAEIKKWYDDKINSAKNKVVR